MELDEDEKKDKGEKQAIRILKLNQHLLDNTYIKKQEVAEIFNVSEKAIQRDLEILRDFLSETHGEQARIAYKSRKGYSLISQKNNQLTREEAMLLTKILLESRAFPKAEMEQLIEKVISQCKVDEQKPISDAIRNEIFLYQPLTHNKPLSKLLGEINNAITQKRLLTIDYMRIGSVEPVTRTLEPLGILFSEFYFYLIANISGGNKEYPAIYRLDRIEKHRVENKHFRIEERARFQEGEFRKQVQFMQMGRLMHVRFRFWGSSIEAVKDRFPNALIKEQSEGSYLVEAKVFGKGVKMWLMSQAEYVEVLAPDDLKQDIEASIRAMSNIYGLHTK